MNKFEKYIINEIKEVINNGETMENLRQDLFYSLNLIYNYEFRTLFTEYCEDITDLYFELIEEGYLSSENINNLELMVMSVIETLFYKYFDNEEE